MALLDVPATLRAVPTSAPTVPAQPADAALGTVFSAPRTDGTGQVLLGGITADGLFGVEAVDPDGHDPDAAGMYRVEFRLLQVDNTVLVASYPDAAELVADPARAVARIVDEARNPARVWNRALDELERLIRGLHTLDSTRATARWIIRTLHRPTVHGEAEYRCSGHPGVCREGYLTPVGGTGRVRHLDACRDCFDGDWDARLSCRRRRDGAHPAWTNWEWCEPEPAECLHDRCRTGRARVDVEPCVDGKDACCGCCHGDPEAG